LFGKSKERVDLLKECAGELFFIIDDALLTDVQLSLSRLADPVEMFGKDNATLERLLKEIAALDVPQLTDELSRRLQTYRDCCQNVKVRRNKQLAHADLGALL
jgi:AbiU2